MKQKRKIKKIRKFAALILQENDLSHVCVRISNTPGGYYLGLNGKDTKQGIVSISREYSYEVGCFVAAHELRHAIQHKKESLVYLLLKINHIYLILVSFAIMGILWIFFGNQLVILLSWSMIISIHQLLQIPAEVDSNFWAWKQIRQKSICRNAKIKFIVALYMAKAQLSYIYPPIINIIFVICMYYLVWPRMANFWL